MVVCPSFSATSISGDFCGSGLTISNKFVDSTKFHLLCPMSCNESNVGQRELLRKADNKELQQRMHRGKIRFVALAACQKVFFFTGFLLWFRIAVLRWLIFFDVPLI